MRSNYKSSRCLLLALSAALVFLLGACGSANANATPTLSVQEIFTAAIETFSAQQATQLALTPPTNTPPPTLFPTLAPLSPLPTFSFTTPTTSTGGVGCDSSVYVSDVTIPDNTNMAADKAFVKTWLLQNNGSCAWSTSYKMSFVTGDLMGGADTALPLAVPAGQQGQVSVSLVAPKIAGTYTGNWRLKNANSQPFGNMVTVVIKVGGGGATATAGTPAAGTVTITGNAQLPQVILSYTDGTAKTVISNDSGDYSLTVPSGWSGTVTPTKGNTGTWVFTPTYRTYSNVTSDQDGQDYTASQ
jgi:hypothetical protein